MELRKRIRDCEKKTFPKGNEREEEDGRKKRSYKLFLFSVVTVLIATTGFFFFYKHVKSKNLRPPDPQAPLPPSPSKLHAFKRAAVCTDGPPCSEIGKNILKKNGSAVDAAIAAMFCNGVVNSQAMGLGGGFLMTIYEHRTGSSYCLNARDSAPGKATQNMFSNTSDASKTGGLAAGVPGELRGYWEAWRRFGRLQWREIVQPAIELCNEGYHMTKPQYDVLDFRPNVIENDPIFKARFINDKTGQKKKFGDRVHPIVLCRSLDVIAEEGGDALHDGSLTKLFVEDIQEKGGIITEKDMQSYRPEWTDPLTVELRDGIKLHTMPPPGSGAVLIHILKILDGYNISSESFSNTNDTILTLHRIVEAFKFAYASRTQLGDPNFIDTSEIVDHLTSTEFADDVRAKINDSATYSNPEHYGAVFYQSDDHGTAHISVLSDAGDAVSVTSTINLYFGAGFTSKRTGITVSSVMDDFSVPGLVNYFGLPPSPKNFIEPQKRPMSSAAPSILVDQNDNVKLVIGAAGGTKIPTSIAWVILRYLWLGENVKEAVDSSRPHHQLMPMKLNYEYGILDEYIKGLEKLGHKTERYENSRSVVCAVSKEDDMIYANADYRKHGDVYGY